MVQGTVLVHWSTDKDNITRDLLKKASRIRLPLSAGGTTTAGPPPWHLRYHLLHMPAATNEGVNEEHFTALQPNTGDIEAAVYR